MSGLFGRLYRGDTHYDFMANKNLYFAIAAALVTVSLASVIFRQFDLSIDFTGGTILEAPNASGADLAEYRNAVAAVGQGSARIQLTGDDQDGVTLATEALGNEEQDALIAALAEAAGVDGNDVAVDAVGPTFGAEITRRAIQALAVFLGVVAIFITLRYEWKMAATTLAAMIHDLVVTAGIYSIVGFEVTPATVIAVLTILGYSLYDGVVVFDKIDENVRALGAKHTFTYITNVSMNEVLMRSIITALTTMIPIGSLLFVGSFLLGATTLQDFALALFVGVGAGTFSSLFLATPLLAVWREREPEWQRMQRRADRRLGDEPVPAILAPTPFPVPPAEEPRPERVAVAAKGLNDTSPGTRPDVVARPPRQRRKRR
ncbi:MAG: protein translocase subunit SecF [Acidimicrobiia bacterium]|nr:protein translocase subunit SecF [Acidimicrobiia bacterium]